MHNKRMREWLDAAEEQGWTVIDIDERSIRVSDGYGTIIRLESTDEYPTVASRPDYGRVREYLRRTPRLGSYYMEDKK